MNYLRASLIIVLLCCQVCGCSLLSRRYAGPSRDGTDVAMPNPLTVPVNDREFAWNQIVDMVDDYFDISREQQVREIGGVLMEGWIDTQPKTGATIAEFLRRDSTPGYERWHSTLQSIRRRASVRVIPVAAGFEIVIQVFKELEDVSQPEYSTVGSLARRHDGSLVAPDSFDDEAGPITLGWIPIGRDESLEQEMLRQLHARFFEVAELPQ